MGSSRALLAIGLAYVAVILGWLLLEGTPSEPIGDPYLAVMEILTLASGLALIGFCAAVVCFCDEKRRVLGLLTLACGTLAAGLTLAVHFVNLTAVRQLWRAGTVDDYRLVWPSPLFAAEYLAWDVLVGVTLLLAAGSLGGRPDRRGARVVLAVAGVCCVAGVSGPASGVMPLQNIAVLGYAVLLPVAALLMSRVFRMEPAAPDSPA